MSRIGKQPVVVPQGVKAEVVGQLIKIEGPKGKLQRKIRPEITASLKDGVISFARKNNSKEIRALHGTVRALVSNMITGVTQGFSCTLDLIGVGYRVEVKGKTVQLSLGFSHSIDYPLPEGVKATMVGEGREVALQLDAQDPEVLGQVAAEIRRFRSPEPYKGKGVRFRGEVIKMKAGKAGKK